jgi:hypothetical protein
MSRLEAAEPEIERHPAGHPATWQALITSDASRLQFWLQFVLVHSGPRTPMRVFRPAARRPADCRVRT